jgi:hypothetical protein
MEGAILAWFSHASVNGVDKAVGVGSALVAVPGHAIAPAPRRGFEDRERHGWHNGFPVRIGIG